MKKISLIIACILSVTLLKAQDPAGNYNPFVAQGIISPAPLLPVENNGTGLASFKVGNTGSDPLVWNSGLPENEMILEIILSRGIPDVAPLDASTALTVIGGSYASMFNWTYDVATNTYRGRQNQTIPGLDLDNFTNEGLITIAYKVTQNSLQAEPLNGFIVSLTPPLYTNISNSLPDDQVSSYTWTVPTGADLSIAKGCTTDPLLAGKLIYYDIQVINLGPSDASGVQVADAVPAYILNPEVSTDGGTSWNPWVSPLNYGSLRANTTFSIQIRGTVKSSLTDGTLLSNTATVSSTTADPDLSNNTSAVDRIIHTSADLSITKIGTPNPIVAGQVITYTLSVNNMGSSDALAVSVADPVPATIQTPEFSTDGGIVWQPWVSPYTIGTLRANNSSIFLIRGTVQSDLPKGYALNNTAAVTSSTSDPNLANNTATDKTIITVPHPYLSIVKTAEEKTYSAVGDLIHYKISVANTSEESIYNISVTDLNATITSGTPISRLGPTEVKELTASHVVTQADLDAGKILNIAEATGSTVDGKPVKDSSNIMVTNGVQRPQLTATKFAAESTYWHAGEIIHYTIEVFNCGNVTAKNIVTSDPIARILSGSPIASLAPRTTVTVTAEYIVTQADVDAGKIVNIASIEGTDPAGKPVRDDSNAVTLYVNLQPKMILAKSAEETSFSAIGDTVHYSIAVRNFRNTTMSEIKVSDPNAIITSVNPIYTLASGKTATVNAYHIITQQDLDAGKVTNVATARGHDYYGFWEVATSNEVVVFANQNPDLLVTKTADETSFSKVGDLIHYTNEIKNTGNVKITGITFTDPNTSVVGNNLITNLNSGESITVRTIHTISQADLNVGFVEQTASATGNDPNSQLIRSISNKLIINGLQQAELASALTAAEITYSLPGEIIHYSIEVRNTGNVTLTNIRLTGLNALFTKGSTIASLVPGAAAMLTAEHPVTQADLIAGKLISSVTVSGNEPNSNPITSISNELTIQANKAEGLTVTEVIQEAGYDQAGEAIHYTITVKNLGKVPVSGITISDPNVTITGDPKISLAAYGSVTLAAQHRVTQTDLDTGLISNTASITGHYPDGTAFAELSSPVTVYARKNPRLATGFSATEASFKAVGDQIHYSIEIKNTGNQSMSDIVLSSEGDLTLSASQIVTLIPGESAKLQAVYTITVADLDAGKVVRAVHVTAQDPDKHPVEVAGNQVSVIGLQNPQLSTIATAAEPSFSDVGQVIHYNIRVMNSGNVSLISTAVTDPNAVIITARPITLLLPGESVMVSASHIITQADMDAGVVVTVATAAGFDLNGNTIEKKGNTVTVNGLQQRELAVSNTAFQSVFKKVGEVINYNLMVRNSGNVTLFTISVKDPALLLSSSVPITSLLPGEAVSVSATHLVTQADMDAGAVVSLAKAAGQDRNGTPVENAGNQVTVTGEQQPELLVTTTTSVSTYKIEESLIGYTVVVKNTGNVTMTDIYVTDTRDLLNFSRLHAPLAPGETDSVQAQHRVTIEDINAGKIVTAGIAHGTILTDQQYSYTGNEVTVRLTIENYNLTNFPNPFSYETTITFDLPEKGGVILKVFDMTGREVAQIDQREFNEGRNFVHWNILGTKKGMYVLKMYYDGNQAVRVISVVN